MPSCAAINCTTRDVRENRVKGITFHRFPHSDAALLRQWLVKVRRDRWLPNARSNLCSLHFTEESFDRTGQTVRLRQNAVPTIFNFPDHLQKNTKCRKLPKERTPIIQESDVPTSSSTDTCPPTPNQPNTFKEHSYAITDSPRKLKRRLDETVEKLDGCKKKLKTQQRKARRLKRKVESLQVLVETLRDEHVVSANCADILEGTFSGVPKEVMQRILQRKEGKGPTAFPEELKAFAMTLQFYSGKAYNYVRKTFNLALPHPRHLRKWYTKVDGDPGFTKQAFTALKVRADSNRAQGKDTVVAVMLDEMAIRRHVEYANGKFQGYVDVGNGTCDDSTPVAKDALVLMAVSVNESWKIPLGYFLIDGMSGAERANLVSECFIRLHDTGVRAVSLTCDGPSCHFTMMKTLGANMTIQGMDPSFPHPADPSEKVHVILDVCHMLKLLRNSFADGGIFKTPDGKCIKWQYIEELNKLQQTEGLRLGNKLKSAHIEWRKQKMKVNLAAQVFSASVADALQYCNEKLKLPQFRSCEATVEFLRHVDGAFDILNSRNPLGKGSKAPMKKNNHAAQQKTLREAEEFLLGLRDGAGTPMHRGPRKTGFIGFVASMRSLSKLFEELVAPPQAPLKYLLAYKFSQDHLELFFSALRARGGFNNNPTARQFKAAYKRLLMRHHIHNNTGNCTILDSTSILHVNEDSISTINMARKYDLIIRRPAQHDHDYADLPNIEQISEYKEAAINYMSGYIVRSLSQRMECMKCIEALSSSDGAAHDFIVMKDRGKLQRPSPSVVAVCLESEKCFQRLLKTTNTRLPQGNGVSSAITSAVLSNTSHLPLFPELHTHQFETAVEENHIHKIVKMVASTYTRIKLYHLGREMTDSITGPKVRKQLTKSVLFRHQ